MEEGVASIKTAVEIVSQLTGALFVIVLPILEFYKLNQARREELSKLKDNK